MARRAKAQGSEDAAVFADTSLATTGGFADQVVLATAGSLARADGPADRKAYDGNGGDFHPAITAFVRLLARAAAREAFEAMAAKTVPATVINNERTSDDAPLDADPR